MAGCPDRRGEHSHRGWWQLTSNGAWCVLRSRSECGTDCLQAMCLTNLHANMGEIFFFPIALHLFISKTHEKRTIFFCSCLNTVPEVEGKNWLVPVVLIVLAAVGCVLRSV